MTKLPSFKEMISTPTPSEIKISPEGDKVAYTLRFPNWKDNRYETACYIYFIERRLSFVLTKLNTETSNIRWFNNSSLAVIQKDFSVEKSKKQIYLYQNLIGDAIQITESENDISYFECYTNGFLYSCDREDETRKNIQDELGDFTHVETEKSKKALFYCNLDTVVNFKKEKINKIETKLNKKNPLDYPTIELTPLFPDRFTIENFFVSNNKTRIFVNCRLKDDLIFLFEKKTFVLDGDITRVLNDYIYSQSQTDIESKKKEKEKLPPPYLKFLNLKTLKLPEGSQIIAIDESGESILIDMDENGENYFYTQKDIWKLNLLNIDFEDVEKIRTNLTLLTKDIKQEIMKTIWIGNEVFFHYFSHCDGLISKFNIELMETEEIKSESKIEILDFDTTQKDSLGIIGNDNKGLFNIYLFQNKENSWKITNISNISVISEDLLGLTEKIEWTSRDGTAIEGILRKPANFDKTKKYPLVLIVHGGPAGVSILSPLDFSDLFYYPTLHFINNDILVLKPNYRGSIGRGSDFLRLNKDNLGIGDLWDIESGVDYLINQGFVDKDRIGCMGWSQGGYISAYATVNSEKFKAISVGAGISDWYTYYVSTDIRLFTVHYLSGSPIKNRNAYLKTSPMTNIQKAKTPTLIQHGSSDARVPYSNGNELFRALKDLGIPVEMFSFTGMPHGINKPKENRAVVLQNFAWFNHHLLNRELSFFDNLE